MNIVPMILEGKYPLDLKPCFMREAVPVSLSHLLEQFSWRFCLFWLQSYFLPPRRQNGLDGSRRLFRDGILQSFR